jgi:hypothetical protein
LFIPRGRDCRDTKVVCSGSRKGNDGKKEKKCLERSMLMDWSEIFNALPRTWNKMRFLT